MNAAKQAIWAKGNAFLEDLARHYQESLQDDDSGPSVRQTMSDTSKLLEDLLGALQAAHVPCQENPPNPTGRAYNVVGILSDDGRVVMYVEVFSEHSAYHNARVGRLYGRHGASCLVVSSKKGVTEAVDEAIGRYAAYGKR